LVPFLKVLARDDEHRAGAVLEAFGGAGMVRVIEQTPDALLLERLDPATPLSTLVPEDDEGATTILASVIAAMGPRGIPEGMPAVIDWASAFDRYLKGGTRGIPHDLVRHARDIYLELAHSQRDVRLLHGDLHHDNVLFDTARGWVAIDPKGVVGELEYELGAALRNPIDLPHVFTDPAAIASRVRILSGALALDADRIKAWAFAQSVLATIWLIEDDEPVPPDHPWLTLARRLEERCSSR
jgi:streptomycin 6-kinase